jgi:hypothetical protein
MLEDDSEGGYKRPPKETQFKKGVSGNPKGRPKGSKSFNSKFLEVSNELITITERGKTRTITKGDAAIHQLVNKAASGDHRALKESTLIRRDIEASKLKEGGGAENDQRERKIANSLLERMKRMGITTIERPTTEDSNETKEKK